MVRMAAMVLLSWAAVSRYADAMPVRREGAASLGGRARRESVYTDLTYGTSMQGRLAYGLVSFGCLFALAFVLGRLMLFFGSEVGADVCLRSSREGVR